VQGIAEWKNYNRHFIRI